MLVFRLLAQVLSAKLLLRILLVKKIFVVVSSASVVDCCLRDFKLFV